jgi:hypothetical protein
MLFLQPALVCGMATQHCRTGCQGIIRKWCSRGVMADMMLPATRVSLRRRWRALTFQRRQQQGAVFTHGESCVIEAQAGALHQHLPRGGQRRHPRRQVGQVPKVVRAACAAECQFVSKCKVMRASIS